MNATKVILSSSLTCHEKVPTTSNGFWYDDNPLAASLPLLLCQLSLIVGVSRTLHFFFRRLNQCEAFSQLLTGVVLGPYVAGKFPGLQQILFPQRSLEQLKTMGLIGYNLFSFTIGVRTDIGMMREAGRKSIAVGLLAILGSMTAVRLGSRRFQSEAPKLYGFAQHLSIAWSVASFPVIASVLPELNLLNSNLGRLALSASITGDIIYLLAFSTYMTAMSSRLQAASPLRAVGVLLSVLALMALIWFVGRRATVWMIRKVPEGAPVGETRFVIILMIALLCGLSSEAIGLRAPTGLFLSGLALPCGPPLGSTLAKRVEGVINQLFVPVFMAEAAFSSDYSQLKDLKEIGYLQFFLSLSVVGKMLGVMAPCLWLRMPFVDAFCLALMINLKGIYEINNLNMWRDRGIVDGRQYALCCLFVFVSMGIMTPLLKALYKPHRMYQGSKGRAVEHTSPDVELRLVLCLHDEEDVPPSFTVVQGFRPSRHNPIALYVLHLQQLMGRTAPLFGPHRRSDEATATDRIAKTFGYIDGNQVQTFVSIAPYASMHDDICVLALEKMAALVILPFHKRVAIDGTLTVANNAHQGINLNVLNYAPCSVAILVDKNLTDPGYLAAAAAGSKLSSVAMLFLGGADDREALAVVARMARNPALSVAVVRFLQPAEWRGQESREDQLDERVLEEFRLGYVDGQRVLYREEVVHDGEGIVTATREMSGAFELFVVGRRQGMVSELTAGLSMWSEHPELGIVGDMLASTDFMGKVSTMVVQQRSERRQSG